MQVDVMQHFITDLPTATSFSLNLMISILALLIFAFMNIASVNIGAATYSYPMIFIPYLITNLGVLYLHYYLPTPSLDALIATVNDSKTTMLLICALQCIVILGAFCLMPRRCKTTYHIGFWAQAVLCMGVRALVVFCESRLFKSSLVAWMTMSECLACSLVLIWQESERDTYACRNRAVVSSTTYITPSSPYSDNKDVDAEKIADEVTLLDFPAAETKVVPERSSRRGETLCRDARVISAWTMIWSLLHTIYYRFIQTDVPAAFSTMTTTEALTLSLFCFWMIGRRADIILENQEKKHKGRGVNSFV